MPPSPLALVKWSTELAESLGKPTSAKFIYDWVKASGGELPSGAELKRLSTAVDQGFNNLIDELRNATNADSGLPAELLWNAKDLAKKTIPDAVEHVSKINAWREAQKVEANAAKAHNAATVLHKDYPDKGFKWVELKAEKGANPAYLGDGQYEDPAMNALKDALKYEGDVMEHCVGGYCPDVVEGRSRIYSLRNTKTGRPHVTIEVVPPTKNTEIQNLQAEFGDNWEDYADPRLIATGKAMGERILQIKGFRNAKPNDEYLPYVQDFVKSGNWADVQDLQNTGLRRLVPESDVGRNLKEFGRELPPYVSEDEMAQLIDWSNGIRKDLPEGFAQGGSVYSPARIDEIVTQHRNSEYDPARVDALVAQLKEEMYG